jgi:hypothetical protein
MTRSFLRFGFVSGVLMLLAVISFGILGATLVAGQPLPANAPEPAVRAYFAHAALAPLAMWQFPAALLGAAFTAALAERLAGTEGAPWARLAFGLFLALAALFVACAALTAPLVDAAMAGAPIMATYRLYDVLYNSGADALEGGAALLFGVALLAAREARVAGWLGVAAGVAHVPLVLEGTLGLPSAVRLLGMLVFVAWAVATLAWLRRAAYAEGADAAGSRGHARGT